MVEVQCETDFVARNPEFVQFASDMAMQVAAVNPLYVSPEAVPAEEVEKQRQAFLAELAEDKKPEDIKAKIVDGKLNKWYGETCLTKTALVKDEDKTVEQLMTELIAKIGEKIVIARFARMEMAGAAGQVC
jgi:elongation factor Ts